MVRHDHEFIQLDAREPPRQRMPNIGDDPRNDRVLQHALAPLGAEGDKIRADLAVIVTRQADVNAGGVFRDRWSCFCDDGFTTEMGTLAYRTQYRRIE